MLTTAATVLSWIVWIAFILGAVFVPNYVRQGEKRFGNPFVRGIMAAIAIPGIGCVFAGTGWFLLLAIRSLF